MKQIATVIFFDRACYVSVHLFFSSGDNAISEEEFYRVMKKRGDNPLDDLSSDED